MLIDTFRITGRERQHPASISAAADFRTEPEGTISATALANAPDWSLYCLDLQEQRAIFVETAPGADLHRQPFLYSAQFEAARRTAIVPLPQLGDLAALAPPMTQVAFLMSTGRCGSTLASRIFAELPGVRSLSEPDCFSNLVFDRAMLKPGMAEPLIAACTRLLAAKADGVAATVIKPRSEAILQAEAYVRALPEAHFAFLYRDLNGYCNSLYRFAQRLLGDSWGSEQAFEIAWYMSSINMPKERIGDYFDDPQNVRFEDALALGWRLRMEGYLAAAAHGVAMTPIHYADLNADRRNGTAALMAACGIGAEHLDLAMRAFERDAHEGGKGANVLPPQPLNAAQRDRLSGILSGWGVTDYSDRRLPEVRA